MKIHNVHERQIRATAQQAGDLLNTLSGPDDKIWPHDHWPRMELDAPLGKGARGGHGPVHYAVREFEAGKKVVFDFEDGGASTGFHGIHYFEIIPHDDSVILRHVIDARLDLLALIRWVLLVRPLHDALMEDCLDRVERFFTGNVEKPAQWTATVRFLRWVIGAKG